LIAALESPVPMRLTVKALLARVPDTDLQLKVNGGNALQCVAKQHLSWLSPELILELEQKTARIGTCATVAAPPAAAALPAKEPTEVKQERESIRAAPVARTGRKRKPAQESVVAEKGPDAAASPSPSPAPKRCKHKP
jgi:hypothetical protein